MMYSVLIYNKISGERETIKVQADNRREAKEETESQTIQVLSISMSPDEARAERQEMETRLAHKAAYIGTRTLRNRREQELCDKQMGIVRGTKKETAPCRW